MTWYPLGNPDELRHKEIQGDILSKDTGETESVLVENLRLVISMFCFQQNNKTGLILDYIHLFFIYK